MSEDPEKTDPSSQKPDVQKHTLYCNFCGKSQYEIRKLIAGPFTFICNECIELSVHTIYEEGIIPEEYERIGNLTPEEWEIEKEAKRQKSLI